MLDKFRLIPAPLQKLILLRLAGSGIGLLLAVFTVASRGSWQLVAPGVLLSFLAFLSAGNLYWDCVDGKIVLLRGVCTDMEHSKFKKQLHSFTILSGEQEIRIMSKNKSRKQLSKGDEILLYLSPKTAVYELDGCQVICDYLAITTDRNQKAKVPD